MPTLLRIAEWNANDLNKHVQEICLFLKVNKTDILLISESHSTEMLNYIITTIYVISKYVCVIRIQHYANLRDGTAQAGSAIIIRSILKQHELESYINNKTQGIILQLEALSRPIIMSTIPRHKIYIEGYEQSLLQLGKRYLVAGNSKVKNTAWGSLLTTPKRYESAACQPEK